MTKQTQRAFIVKGTLPQSHLVHMSKKWDWLTAIRTLDKVQKIMPPYKSIYGMFLNNS